jgi:5-methylcytosine-specific restriction endonuclease McrA
MALVTLTEAASQLGFSRELVEQLTKNCPKRGETRTLSTKNVDDIPHVDTAELEQYRRYLNEPWPKPSKGRPHIPEYIKEDVRAECHYQCAICGSMDNGEVAHIAAVASSLNNSPDNLLLLCPNHHTKYDYGYKPASNVTEEEVRAAKKIKRSSRRRMLKFEIHTEGALLAVLALIRDMEKKASESDDLHGVYLAEVKGLLTALPEMVAAAQNDASKDRDPSSAGRVLKEKARQLTKAAAGIGKASESAVKSAAKTVIEISSPIMIDLDEHDCPHCGGCGQTGLVGDLCAYCGGSCVVSSAKAEEYDRDDLDEVDCPHCNGVGKTGLVNDLCSYCGGSCVVSSAKAGEYDRDDVDEVDCPHCNGAGKTGLVSDLCSYCGGSCVVSSAKAKEYDRDEVDEADCPHCGGSGKTGLVGDLCSYCGGSCVVSSEKAKEYYRDNLDEVDCPHCGGRGQTGLVGDLCSYCGGSCVVSSEKAREYDRDEVDEVDCPRCNGAGMTGLVGDLCRLCKGSCVVSSAVRDAYREKYG